MTQQTTRVEQETLVQLLMRRDGLSETEAEEQVDDARSRVKFGEDPEEILYEEFGVEPDFVFELLEGW